MQNIIKFPKIWFQDYKTLQNTMVKSNIKMSTIQCAFKIANQQKIYANLRKPDVLYAKHNTVFENKISRL